MRRLFVEKLTVTLSQQGGLPIQYFFRTLRIKTPKAHCLANLWYGAAGYKREDKGWLSTLRITGKGRARRRDQVLLAVGGDGLEQCGCSR